MGDDITQMLAAARSGQTGARDALFAHVYADLRRIARSKIARESTLTQLDAASLVHEAYLRLNRQAELPAGSRGAFFAYAANVMRSVIVDYVRERNAAKRGSHPAPVTLLTQQLAAELGNPEIEGLDRALHDLERVDARCLQIVELRFFAGLSIEEVADALELSPATVKRDWQKARAFLFHALAGAGAA